MKPVKQGGRGRECGERRVSLAPNTLEEEPLIKRMGKGIRAPKKDEGVVQRAGPLPSGATQ